LVDIYIKMLTAIDFGNVVAWIVFGGIVLGVTGRTILPYWGKIQSGEINIFDKKFLGTALAAFIGSFTPSVILFPVVMDKIGPDTGNLALPIIFVVSAGFGFGANDLANLIMKYFAKNQSVSVRIQQEVRKQVDVQMQALRASVQQKPTKVEEDGA
jgi:hypothetical protein